MAMKKFGDAESAHVFRGVEASVVSEHIQKLGKPVSDFSKDEKVALEADLVAVRPVEEEENADQSGE